MSAFVTIAVLGASSVANPAGVPLWEPAVPTSDDESDIEPFGPTAVYQSLGVSSAPWPKDDNGWAEAVVFKNCAGRTAFCVAARDTRSAKIVGNLKPGDTVVHSTGPSQAPQLQLKEATNGAVLLSKSKKTGKSMMIHIDGENGTVQITHAGAMFEIDDAGDVSILNAAGAGFLIQGQDIFPTGTLHLGAGNPPGSFIMLGMAPVSPGGIGTIPLTAAKGIALGT